MPYEPVHLHTIIDACFLKHASNMPDCPSPLQPRGHGSHVLQKEFKIRQTTRRCSASDRPPQTWSSVPACGLRAVFIAWWSFNLQLWMQRTVLTGDCIQKCSWVDAVISTSIFNAVLPEGLKITAIQYSFLALFLPHIFSECLNDIMSCRWWKPWILCTSLPREMLNCLLTQSSTE